MNTQADPNSKQTRKKALAAVHNAAMRANLVEGDERPTDEQRAELERLSSKLYRASSKYVKMLRNGIAEQVTEEVEEYVPEEKDAEGKVIKAEEFRKVQVPVAIKDKNNQPTKSILHTVRRFTPASLIAFLQDREKKYDAFMAKLKEAQEAQRKKQQELELAKELQEQAGGTTLG